MKQTKFIIPEEQQVAAAKYFALSNLALLGLAERFGSNIHVAYAQANEVMKCEAGCSISGELSYWIDQVENPNKTLFAEWSKARVNYGF